MERKIFYKANSLVFANAKKMRNDLTHEEKLLWGYLKTNPPGYKFRRQHPLGIYIADFYCHKLKLVIEVDGSIHDVKEVKEQDEQRQKMIEAFGIKVIRFRNEAVMYDLEKTIEQIQTLLR